MALVVPDLPPPHEAVSKLERERRQAERAITYWEQKAAEVRARPTLTQLDPGETIDCESWAHRFVIAPDHIAEVSTFLMCGSNAARLLELSDAPLKYAVMFRKMPRRFLEIFTRGCGDAISAGAPARLEGAIERDDGRRELYRSVFMPIGVNLVFGAYNSLMTETLNGPSRRLDDRSVGSLLPVIHEIQAGGIASPRGIATALNTRGFRTVRGRNWTSATVRNLLPRLPT
jgi:hypothetical protein